jgi:hypothetical protein
VEPPQAAINDLTNGNGIEVLFPADQAMAGDAFAGGTASYPAAAPASTSVISAQGHASLEWFDGADPAGRETSKIPLPTLVADGTDDQLDPVSNSRAIASLIPGAKLLFYPDAGHGFLFQEGTPFAFAVESFLAGTPAPLSTAAIRSVLLSGVAQTTAAGETWAAKLKALGARPTTPEIPGLPAPGAPTAAEVAAIDQPLANAVAGLDYRLLSAGATGTAGDAIATFVTADERLANDYLALAGLSASTVKTWLPTITKDGAGEQRAEAAMRKALLRNHRDRPLARADQADRQGAHQPVPGLE